MLLMHHPTRLLLMGKQRKKDLKQQEEREKRRQERRAKRAQATIDVRDTAFVQEEVPLILIVCEGVNTEPSYFRWYQSLVAALDLEIIGVGKGLMAVVDCAIVLAKAKEYDVVWCVFDREHPKDVRATQFDKAIQAAKNSGFEIAYSNQAFEYWLLLHFNDHQGGRMNKEVCCQNFNALLQKYSDGKIHYDCKKSKLISKELFDFLHAVDETHPKKITFQQQALNRAQAIHHAHTNGHHAHSNPNSPATQESSTTLYQLVAYLNQYSHL